MSHRLLIHGEFLHSVHLFLVLRVTNVIIKIESDGLEKHVLSSNQVYLNPAILTSIQNHTTVDVYMMLAVRVLIRI